MPELRVRLFGKFSATYAGRELDGLGAVRVQELLAYLLLGRGRQHPRETLAGLLWGESSTAQARKYLRQALWQLQSALEAGGTVDAARLLGLDADWLYLNPEAQLWCDVDAFELTFAPVRGVPGQSLDDAAALRLQEAVDLYRGDLLEGWYQEWCLYDRERLQTLYLAMLDKLAAYCEAHAFYEAGLGYAAAALRYDRADERTHRRLMKLQYLLGDRTAALRQYERCRQALRDELGVEPARITVVLHEQIKSDRLVASVLPQPPGLPARPSAPLSRTLARLTELHALVADIQREVEQDALAADLSAHPGL